MLKTLRKAILAAVAVTLASFVIRAQVPQTAQGTIIDATGEPVVVGYGVQKKVNVTGAVSMVLALLLKSRVALYEATFEKYHKGSGRVPGDANWPGASRHAGESFNIDAEVNFFLDQCLEAAAQVADAHPLAANTGVINPGKDVQYKWNPYFEMFSQPNPGTVDEVLLWRQFDKDLNIVTGFQTYILEGGNAGATRSHVDGFLMKNGLPIYDAASGYKGDESLDLQQEGRDDRLQLFVFGNSDILYPSNRSTFDAPLFMPPQVEHHDRTGFRVRKSFSYDPAQSEQAHGSHVGTNGTVLFRSAEAYLNYIEAYYEKNGAISGKADTYWRALRKRAGIDEDYNKTIAATNLSKEDDWGKRSGETLVDATLFNIRRERRCEFIGEGFRRGDRIEL